MNLEFRNIVTLSFIYGFFAVFGLILYVESSGFTKSLSESQLVNILIGALIGSVATITAFLYKAKKANGEDD